MPPKRVEGLIINVLGHLGATQIQSCPFICPPDFEQYIPININSDLTNKTE